MWRLILEAISRYMKNKKVIGSGQHGCMKGKLYFTNRIAFSSEMIGLLEERTAAVVAYLDFLKAFNIVSLDILIDKLIKYGVDK